MSVMRRRNAHACRCRKPSLSTGNIFLSDVGAIRRSMCHVWGAREDGKMNDRNGFTDDNAREPRQRLSERDMAMILRRMASDAVSHANGLGSLARMIERGRSEEHTSELQSLMRI